MDDYAISFHNLENLNRLIINLYDNHLPIHTRISNFFRDIAAFIYFDRASVMIYYKLEDGSYQKLTSFSINWNQKLLKDYDSYYCRLDDTLAPLDRPEPTVLRSSSFFNQELRSKTEYWNGYMLPNNADYEIMGNLQLHTTEKYRGILSFTRGKEAGDFNNFHMRLLRFFQPHMSRLVQGYLEQCSDDASLPEQGNYNCIGYCTLNDSCQIIKKNGIFDKLNTAMNNRLLGKIVSLCIDMGQSADTSDTLNSEYKFEDTPLFLEITCMPANLDGSKKQYCCLVYDLSHFFDLTLRQAKEQYQLTDREYDILLGLIHGKRQEDLAAQLFLSVPTVKKYVAGIYSKLGITNQKQIYTRLNLV